AFFSGPGTSEASLGSAPVSGTHAGCQARRVARRSVAAEQHGAERTVAELDDVLAGLDGNGAERCLDAKDGRPGALDQPSVHARTPPRIRGLRHDGPVSCRGGEPEALHVVVVELDVEADGTLDVVTGRSLGDLALKEHTWVPVRTLVQLEPPHRVLRDQLQRS